MEKSNANPTSRTASGTRPRGSSTSSKRKIIRANNEIIMEDMVG